MEFVTKVVECVNTFLWDYALLILLLGAGIIYSFSLKFIQVRKFGAGMKALFGNFSLHGGKGENGLSSFQALTTAIAAQVGTGNIAGAATAIASGGPGSIFWMWVSAFFGMATKYAEGLLAVKYREVDAKGEIAGGPMFYIKNGMGEKYKWLGTLFAIFGVLVAYFGIGTFAQVNSIVDITKMTIGLDPMWTAVILTVLVAAITLGGLQSIAAAASKIVPAMAVIYFISTIGV